MPNFNLALFLRIPPFFCLEVVCLPPHFNCLFLFVCSYVLDSVPAFTSCLVESAYVVGVLSYPVVQSPWSPGLEDLRMLSVWVMWILLLCLIPDYCWPICCLYLSSSCLSVRIYPYHIFYAVVQVLREQSKTTQKQNPYKQNLPHTIAISMTKEKKKQ